MNKTEESKKTKQLKPTIVPFEKLENGKFEFGDSGEDFNSLPSWVDIERAKRGQKYVQKYLYGNFFAHFLALLVVFTNKDIRNVLMFTEKSETVDKAMLRYFSTMIQVLMWYYAEITEDLNSPFFKAIRNVRQVHKGVAFSLEKKLPEFKQPLVKDTEEEEAQLNGGKKVVKRFWRAVKSDVESAFPNYSPNLRQEKRKIKPNNQPSTSNQYYFSQYDMSIVQWNFCLPIHCPQKFGIFHATKEEYDGFLHLWAIIGHTLGMKPEYNLALCLGSSVEEYQSYSKKIFDNIVFPEFFQLNFDVEVLWEALAKGTEKEISVVSYEFFLIMLTESFLEVKPHNLKKLCSFHSKLRYFLWKYLIIHLLKHSSWLRQKATDYVWHNVCKIALKYFNADLTDLNKVKLCAFNPPKTS